MPLKSNSLSNTDIKDILKSQGIKIKGVYMKECREQMLMETL